MKAILKPLLLVLFSATVLLCQAQKRTTFKAKEIYKSARLIITQVAPNSFEHISFLQTTDFGNVECNGLVVRNNGETIVFDTPANDSASTELINWIRDSLRCKINAVIPTHFHHDCLGGLTAFDEANVPSYAYFKTIELAKENKYAVPANSFQDSLVLKVGDQAITAKFLGEGHTIDNVVGYFTGDNILFGGCLVKEIGAGKGYLGDANVAAWPTTVEKVRQQYPDVKIVIPGHGDYGNQQLLYYTIKLFKPK